MTPMGRRDFLVAAAAGGAGALLPGWARGAGAWRGQTSSADARIEVLLDEPVGTIAPEIYGHFTEHLGGVIYGGVWVGEQSQVPNIGGIRRALVEALRTIKPSVIRWPGGCFADSYDWRDGVGPRERRPKRTNFWADDPGLRKLGDVPATYDPNAFGTSEFARFCRLVGAQPYLAVNVRSLPARVFDEWLEFCNAPAGSTTWAGARAAAGDRDPYGVPFWGIGNEAWGCGGNFTPEEYAEEYRRFTTWAVPRYGVDLAFIGSGPSGGDLEWTQRFFAALAERYALNSMWGWSLHHYSSAEDAGADAVAFDDRGWYELLASADRMESLITSQWQEMGRRDREHKIKLVVDEWGAWHKTAPLVDASHLFESQSTMRDALVAGLTLDTFNRHADKVAMAAVAQLVNCIQSLFFTHGDQLVVTPVYHVFGMYADHQGGRAARTEWSAPRVSWTDKKGETQEFWGLNGSASVRDRVLTLTVTNPALAAARETELAVRGGTIASVRATTLAARSMHDVNSFDHPDAVRPVTADVASRGATLTYTFPPASVTKLQITLAG
jgi:alpha-L-arabinofuranosidase